MADKAPAKKNAAQRLDDLEAAMSQYYMAFNNLAADVLTIKEALKLLGNKVDSVVQALDEGMPVNDDTISAKMVQSNIQTLKDAVTKLIDDGILVPGEAVGTSSFLVGQEVNDEGAVIQPRTQFAMAALPEELQTKIFGSKAGDVLDLQPGKLKLSIQEVYSIVAPTEPTQEA